MTQDEIEARFSASIRKLTGQIQKQLDEALALNPSEALRRDIQTWEQLLKGSSPPVWTRSRPTVPGLYACRDPLGDYDMVRCVSDYGVVWVHTMKSPPDGCLYYGPIPDAPPPLPKPYSQP